MYRIRSHQPSGIGILRWTADLILVHDAELTLAGRA
jgi:hypothetical protein